MKNKRKPTLLVALIALVAATGIYFSNQQKSETQRQLDQASQISLGSKVFAQNCASCHGREAVGENSRFIKGGAKDGGGYWAPALNGTAHTWHHPPEMIWEIVKFGSMAQDSPMRGFNGKLSDRQIKAAIAYIQSLWPEEIQKRYKMGQKHQM